MDHKSFTESLNNMMGEAHTLAQSKGWWTPDPGLPTALVMVHAEVSEMVEAIRNGNPSSQKIPEFSCAEEEAADVVIRIMDLCASRDFRLAEAIVAKHKFNKNRSYRHGGKSF